MNRFTTQSLHDSVGQTRFVNSVDWLVNSVDRVTKLPGLQTGRPIDQPVDQLTK